MTEAEEARAEKARLREEMAKLRRGYNSASTGKRVTRARKPSQRSAEILVQKVCMMSGEGIVDTLEKIKSRAKQLGKIQDE